MGVLDVSSRRSSPSDMFLARSDAMQVQGVEEAIHRCLVNMTLVHPPQIDVEIKTAVLA